MGEPRQTESAHSARDRILDAAESVFAEDGFAGAGMKAIALRAGVAQGLLHYHFENKEGLYAAVIERRSGLINAERLERLAQVDLSAPGALEAVLRALLLPPLGPSGGGQAYARIFAGLTGGDARDADLVRRHYDPTAQRFIDALHRVCPGASRRSVAWAYTLAIGSLAAALGQGGRPDRLAGLAPGAGSEADPDLVVEHIVTFAAGGLRALTRAAATSDRAPPT